MRKRAGIAFCAVILAGAAPAWAQFGTPFGGPGLFTTPEVAGGAIGAGAANNAAQQQCGTVYAGRGGPQYQCAPAAAPASPPAKR